MYNTKAFENHQAPTPEIAVKCLYKFFVNV